MSGQDYEQLALSAAGSPASPSPSRESAWETAMAAIYGPKCSESYGKLSLVGSLLKTSLGYCELPATGFARTWSVKATQSGYLIMKLRLSARRTGGSGPSLLPTPTATLANHGGPNQRDSGGRPGLQMAAVMWPTPLASDSYHSQSHKDGAGRPGLAAAARLWRTPGAQDGDRGAYATYEAYRKGVLDKGKQASLANQVKFPQMWPTPTTGAGLCGGAGNFQQLQALKDAGLITEGERKNMSQGNGGSLNPAWVEWLMGFPAGWTGL